MAFENVVFWKDGFDDGEARLEISCWHMTAKTGSQYLAC